MRFVLRVIAFILALSLTPAFSQTLNRSARISDALPGSSSTFDLPNAPAPRALDGANLAGPDFATPLVQPVGTASATDSTVSQPAFIEATRMSFSPSAYILVGMSSLAAEAQNVHPTLGE